jgi:hypothetical protein
MYRVGHQDQVVMINDQLNSNSAKKGPVASLLEAIPLAHPPSCWTATWEESQCPALNGDGLTRKHCILALYS